MNKPYIKIASILLALSGLVYIFCLIVSGGSGNENGPGAVWWLFLFFGIPPALAGLLVLFAGIFTELTKSKTVNINGKRHSLGSAIILSLLFVLLAYILYSGFN